MSWTLTSGATTKSFADWGLSQVSLTLRCWATDTLTFRATGRAIDAAPLFAIWSTVSVKDPSGTQCFVGIVTKIPVLGSSRAEDQTYTVSGPWWYFENLVFQQEWNIDPLGNGTLVPTLRTTTIIGQQSDGTRLDLGQMASIIINYVLSTAAAQSFVPFQTGSMTPDTTIPFSEVSDRTCADLMVLFFSFVPDAVQWFDYSVSPPRLNISQRGNGTPVNLAAFGGPVSEIDLTPRSDLVVPAVVLKYAQTNTIDGTVYSTITPDIYPPDAPDPGFRNLVGDVDLLPGNATFQKQSLTTTDRPKDYDSIAGTGALTESTFAWLTGEHRAFWLKSYIVPANWPTGQAPYVQGNNTDQDVVVNIPDTDFTVRRVTTTLASNFVPTPPDTGLVLPTGTVPPGGGPGTGSNNALDYLDQELLKGSVTDWMTTDQSVYSAHVNIAITVQYTGDDPVVQQWFSPGPTRLLTLHFPTLVTNGTGEYSELASETPSEPVPTGLAQKIYEGLSVLHYEGTIGTTEMECSSAVGMGNVLNLTGASGSGVAWATMNAQIFEIARSLDDGKTRIRVGPPVYLDANKLVQILRAIRGRIQSYHLDQQKTGKADTGNSVQGAGDTARSGAHTPPGGSAPPALLPFAVTVRPNPSNPTLYQAKVNVNSDLMLSLKPNDNMAITGLDTWFDFIANDLISLYLVIEDYAVTSATIQSYGAGTTSFDPTLAAWDSSDLSYVFDDGADPPNAQQIGANIMIAYSTPDSLGNPFLVQAVFDHLMMQNVVIDGRAACYAFPATARRYGVTS